MLTMQAVLQKHIILLKQQLLIGASHVPFVCLIFSCKGNDMSIIIPLREFEKLRLGGYIISPLFDSDLFLIHVFVGPEQEYKWGLPPCLYTIKPSMITRGWVCNMLTTQPPAQAPSTPYHVTHTATHQAWKCTHQQRCSPSGKYTGRKAPEVLEKTQGNLTGNSDPRYLECDLKGRVWVPGGYVAPALWTPWPMGRRAIKENQGMACYCTVRPSAGPLRPSSEDGIRSVAKKWLR